MAAVKGPLAKRAVIVSQRAMGNCWVLAIQAHEKLGQRRLGIYEPKALLPKPIGCVMNLSASVLNVVLI